MGDLQRRVIERNADIRDIFRIARDCNLLVISFLDEIKKKLGCNSQAFLIEADLDDNFSGIKLLAK